VRKLKINNFATNTIVFMLIITRSMKLHIVKLCVVCLGGVIVVNYENKIQISICMLCHLKFIYPIF
jgi:hypothetical protein